MSMLSDSHDATTFIAAMILFNSFNNAHKMDQYWIKKNMSKMVSIVKQRFQLIATKISYQLTPIKGQHKSVHNVIVYQNVCIDSNLQMELQKILTLNQIPMNNIFLESNLVPIVMETHKTKCAV